MGMAACSMVAGWYSRASCGTPFCIVLAAYSCICEVAVAESSVKVISSTHLMQVHPYHPGTTRRTGDPWSLVSGLPFISVARNAPAFRSSSVVNTQLAPGIELADFVV